MMNAQASNNLLTVYPQRSAYHLTEEQVRFFDEYGYLILRNWIPQYLLKRLQDAASAWITMGSNVVERGGYEDDFKFAQRSYCSAGDAGNAS